MLFVFMALDIANIMCAACKRCYRHLCPEVNLPQNDGVALLMDDGVAQDNVEIVALGALDDE